MANRAAVARALADAFLSLEWVPTAMAAAGRTVIGSPAPWIDGLAKRATGRFVAPPLAARLAGFIVEDRGFVDALDRLSPTPLRIVAPVTTTPAQGRPPPALAGVELPDLATPRDLARWLGLTTTRLDWFAGVRGGERRCGPGPLRHYRHVVRCKPTGGLRVLEAPKARLKEIQRRILSELLRSVPAHAVAHGFVRGRSALTAARLHAGAHVVIRLDLADFFSSIASPRVFGLFATLGYPESVARLLTGLCTTVTPTDVLASLPRTPDLGALAARHALVRRLRARHLPQGSPSSPALSNLIARTLDCRLSGMADACAAVYTRYADDLAFSGDMSLARGASRFIAAVERIVDEEGFSIRQPKTRIMRRSSRQEVVGLVVNEKPNLARAEYDRLKAIVYNCATRGPHGQNRTGHPLFKEHLAGRIAHLEHVHPQRGAKVREVFARIDWS